MALQIDRRRLLATGALSSLAALLPSSKGRTQPASRVNLTAGRRTLEVNGRAATVFGLTQPDGTHCLFTEIGKPFRLTLHNDAETDTLIHWHGLCPPYRRRP